MASTYLERNMTGNTASTKMTYSGWIKVCNTSNDGRIFGAQALACHTYFYNSQLHIDFSAKDSGTVSAKLQTNRVFRDTSAWYHFVFTLDTTQATADDRIKFWVNGVQETSFATRTNPSLNATYAYGQSGYYSVGARTANQGGAGHYFDGAMSHIHYCDGYAYQASDFGQYDANGIWTIKTSPSVTYGTNGFFILKDGNSVTDQSGNGNNFTVAGGTLTNTEDNPSNVFATMNPLMPFPSGLSFANGNTTLTTSASQWTGSASTFAPSSGKWYWEAKYNTGSGIKLDIGRIDANFTNMNTLNNSYLSYNSTGYGYQLNNTGTDYYCNNNACTTWNSSRGNSTKIYMVAVDLDNGKMWIGADGTWFNKSGTANPVTGDDPLHDFSSDLNGDGWFFGMSVEGSGGSHNANFGNGYFGTTAVASAGTNASGNGIFEYDVPTGYTALSTKGLNL